MTRAFERFLCTLGDDDLALLAAERSENQRPYWRTLTMALRIEMSRRGLALEPSRSVDNPSQRPVEPRDASE